MALLPPKSDGVFATPKGLALEIDGANGDGFVVTADPPNVDGAGDDPNKAEVPLPKGVGAELNGAGDPNGDKFEENVDCGGVPNGVAPDIAALLGAAEPKPDDGAEVGAAKGLD